MASIAAFVASRGLAPDLALVSPSLRTRETWGLLLPAFTAVPALRIEPRLYASSADRILYLVRETGAEIASLLLVGHNPGLEELAHMLSGAGQTDALIRFGGSMPTASLAVIDLTGDWPAVETRTGRLEMFVTPKSLGADS
ncbi:MAG TPA: histidine phosphatase family protein [Xanthobacteraceae bacterium]|nr:histidine phosphatase family protein [Xanthobacteraceae bacterium]